MAKITLTTALKNEYSNLFDACIIDKSKEKEVDRTAEKIVAGRNRYEAVSTSIGMPWYLIGVIHCMEASLRFDRHLHNGDPLTARTVQVPKGRPLKGNPPFRWEESAEDALRLQRLDKATDWSIPSTLYKLEAYNGFGYRLRHPEVLTPYLWSYSNHYTSGKYVADGTFSPTAKSKQCGAAVLLRRLAEMGLIQFEDQPADPATPLVSFSTTRRSKEAAELQRALNRLPGVFLRVDGLPSKRTSDACRRVFGQYLAGDPRSKAQTLSGTA